MMLSRVRLLPLFLVLLAFAARPAVAGIDRWTPLGPDGGTVLALVADAGSPGTLYAGTYGGVWKSLDGGAHWFSSSEGLSPFEITALAVAPSTPGTVWAGTPQGIYQTTNGGATWRLVWFPLDDPDVSLGPSILSLVADPADPAVAWAGTQAGKVLKTTDSGATWEAVHGMPGGVSAIAVDPTATDTVYAMGGGEIQRTADGGLTWTRLRAGEDTMLVLDPVDPRVLYAAGSFDGIRKSTDAGATWSRLPGFNGRALGLFVDPTDHSVVFAGGSFGTLMRSGDAGATWQGIEGLPGVLSLAFAADPAGRLWLGVDDRGVFRSLDGGRTWRTSREGLGASQAWDVTFDPFLPRILYAALDATGFHRSTDGGVTWTLRNVGLPVSGGSGYLLYQVAPHPLVPKTLYAGTGGGLYRSRDRGAHWSPVLRFREIRSISFDPRDPQTIFAGGGTNLFRTLDGGRTWKWLPLPGTFSDLEISQVQVSPLRPRTVYVVDADRRYGRAGRLFRSTNRGETWRRVFTQGPAALAFHPTDPGVLYVGTESGGEIWKSVDQGTTWERIAQDVGNGARITALLIDRTSPSVLYAGTDGAGVWRSTDGGTTWVPLASGMIAPRITSLEADPRNPRRLLAGTWGGGVLEIRLTTP